jgi:hypothetical protein
LFFVMIFLLVGCYASLSRRKAWPASDELSLHADIRS